MVKVSVVVNCFNGEKYLREALDSVSNQTYKNYEIIFIDNCSNDNSQAIAKEYEPQLKYFCTPKNIPLGGARNFALDRALGEYIAFLDCDDIWLPEKLAMQVDILDRNANVTAVMSNFIGYNMQKNSKNITHKNWKDKLLDFSEFVCQYSYCMSTFMIRKSSLDKMDFWFDEQLQYAEEYDLFCRLALHGSIYRLKEPLAIRRIHGEMNTMKLADRIPIEHQITLDNLRKVNSNFDSEYPEVVRNIEYLIAYTDSKRLFPLGETKKIRMIMKPFRFYNSRAIVYYFMSLLPVSLSQKIYNAIYYKSISGASQK